MTINEFNEGKRLLDAISVCKEDRRKILDQLKSVEEDDNLLPSKILQVDDSALTIRVSIDEWKDLLMAANNRLNNEIANLSYQFELLGGESKNE